MKNASIIIRFSNQSGRRLRDLHILLAYLMHNPLLEIILSIMERDVDQIPDGIIKTFKDATFESSQANNIGASLASTNIMIFQDADIIFDIALYDRIIYEINHGYESVRVGEQCVNLGEVNMQKMRLNAQEVISYKFPSCFRDAPGACIALSRDAFIKVGGCCELFKVYGWEDVYFRYKVKTLTKQTCLNAQMIHMPHETNYQIDKQPVNAPLYHELLYTDNGDCVKLSMRDREYLLSHYPTIRR